MSEQWRAGGWKARTPDVRRVESIPIRTYSEGMTAAPADSPKGHATYQERCWRCTPCIGTPAISYLHSTDAPENHKPPPGILKSLVKLFLTVDTLSAYSLPTLQTDCAGND